MGRLISAASLFGLGGFGTFAERLVYDVVSNVLLWCVGLPVAVLFAAWLIGIAVMCARELWRTRERPRKKTPRNRCSPR